MSLFTAQLYPGQALGFLVLGASLHDILTRLKAEPQRFPKLDLVYSPSNPIREPVILGLPSNGVRLRFDGPEQRLRLIEVIDFTKNHITFKEQNNERDLVRPTATTGASASPFSATATAEPSATTGPTFKHIYNRFLGPTYDGEFIPGSSNSNSKDEGTYVLSYPGVAFSFPMARSAYSPDKDVMSLLSHNGTQVAVSMAVFSGDSWAQARETLWTEVLPSVKTFTPLAKGLLSSTGGGGGGSRDACPDEVSLVRIHGGGKLQLFRKWASASVWITLGETSPQDLVAELGPPDAIYRKNDQRMYIHRVRTASSSRARPSANGMGASEMRAGGVGGGGLRADELTDTDLSSANTASDEDDSNDEAIEDDFAGNVTGECFYNYFYLGFDVLISTRVAPSRPPPSKLQNGASSPTVAGESTNNKQITSESADRLVATKLILHGNIPGSYPFNRHRRCRWQISYLDPQSSSENNNTSNNNTTITDRPAVVNSETPFSETEERLRAEWKPIYHSEAEARQRQRGMVLNRGWGDSPGSSCELLGGWEGDGKDLPGIDDGGRKFDGGDNSTTTLYGFPGLVFEVLRNGFVSAVTVF